MQEDHARRSRTRQIAIPLACVAGLRSHSGGLEADKDYTVSRQYCPSATAPSQLKLTKPAAGLLQRIVTGQMLSPWQLLQSQFSCFSLYLKLVIQARATRLPDEKLDAFWTSPLLRAKELLLRMNCSCVGRLFDMPILY
ncbi:hypothetical protein QL285_034654 [Trifolium repens]|nr:hypothetical protein QL285_034654 [Trifolium repens]